jgi:hypothetical protein
MKQTSKVILFREVTPESTAQWCVLTGSPADGFTVNGPFDTRSEAEAWAHYSYAPPEDEGDSWWIMELESVDNVH